MRREGAGEIAAVIHSGVMIGRRGRRLAIVATLAAGLASCEALVGISDKELASPDTGSADGDGRAGGEAGGDDSPTPTDGTVGGDHTTTDAPVGNSGDASDGGNVATDTGTTGDTGGPNDGARPVDSATDAPASTGDGGDGAPPMDPDVPCSQQPTFIYCNDFDSVSTVGDTWDYTYNNNAEGGAILQLCSTTYVSPPHSVQMITPPAVSDDIQLGKDVGTLYSGCRLAFDVRVDVSTLTGIPQIIVAQLYLERAINPLQVNLAVGPGDQAALQVMGASDAGPTYVNISAPTPMTWVRLAIAYDLTAGVSVYENGQLQGTLAVGSGEPGDTKIIMGDSFVGTGGSQTVTTEEDNIVLSGH
jgi:hypothetical protein